MALSSVNLHGNLRHFVRRDSYRLTVDLRSPIPSRHLSLVPTRHTFSVARVMSLLGGCSFDGRHELSFRCVIFGNIGSSLVCTGRLIGLLHKMSYEVGLVHFRTVPKMSLRKASVRTVMAFHSCLASRNIFSAVHTSHNRSVFTTYNVLSATGQRNGGGGWCGLLACPVGVCRLVMILWGRWG